jgi:phage internal scaffolding protein
MSMKSSDFSERVYDDGRTKQAFKDSTDVNKIIARHQRAGTLSHLAKYEGQYGDFSDFDFFEAQNQLAKAKTIFDELPSEIRREFNNDPSRFFEFANEPENVGKLAEILPDLARPGRQFPLVFGQTRSSEPDAPVVASNEQPAVSAPVPPVAAENASESDSSAS